MRKSENSYATQALVEGRRIKFDSRMIDYRQ